VCKYFARQVDLQQDVEDNVVGCGRIRVSFNCSRYMSYLVLDFPICLVEIQMIEAKSTKRIPPSAGSHSRPVLTTLCIVTSRQRVSGMLAVARRGVEPLASHSELEIFVLVNKKLAPQHLCRNKVPSGRALIP
jgi:hypothetical protein